MSFRSDKISFRSTSRNVSATALSAKHANLETAAVSSSLAFSEQNSTTNPGSGKGSLYVKSTAPSTLVFVDDANIEANVGRKRVIEYDSNADGNMTIDASFADAIVALSLTAAGEGDGDNPDMDEIVVSDSFPIGASVKVVIVASDPPNFDITVSVESGVMLAFVQDGEGGVSGQQDGFKINVTNVAVGDYFTLTRVSESVVISDTQTVTGGIQLIPEVPEIPLEGPA